MLLVPELRHLSLIPDHDVLPHIGGIPKLRHCEVKVVSIRLELLLGAHESLEPGSRESGS